MKENETIIFTANREGRLYIVEEMAASNTRTAKTVNETTWHNRLGHLHQQALDKLLVQAEVDVAMGQVNGPPIDTQAKCDICVKGR